MRADVDAVIAALRAVLSDAERRTSGRYHTRAANRWINQLPGAWLGRWRHLKLRAQEIDHGFVDRRDFIVHVTATIAYLEVNREAIQSTRAWPWSYFNAARRSSREPVDVEFSDVHPTGETRKPLHLIKSD